MTSSAKATRIDLFSLATRNVLVIPAVAAAQVAAAEAPPPLLRHAR